MIRAYWKKKLLIWTKDNYGQWYCWDKNKFNGCLGIGNTKNEAFLDLKKATD